MFLLINLIRPIILEPNPSISAFDSIMTSSLVHGFPSWHSLTCQGMLGFVHITLNWVIIMLGWGNLTWGILGFMSYLGLFLGEKGKNAGKDLNGNKCFMV